MIKRVRVSVTTHVTRSRRERRKIRILVPEKRVVEGIGRQGWVISTRKVGLTESEEVKESDKLRVYELALLERPDNEIPTEGNVKSKFVELKVESG